MKAIENLVFGLLIFGCFGFLLLVFYTAKAFLMGRKIPKDQKLLLKKRSKGVTILAIFLTLSWAITNISTSLESKANYATLDWFDLIIINNSYFLCAMGLLRLKEWARKLTIGIKIYDLVTTFILLLRTIFPSEAIQSIYRESYLGGVIGASSLLLVFLLYPGLIIYFLTRPKVKEQFNLRE